MQAENEYFALLLSFCAVEADLHGSFAQNVP